jgi:hypothetical protein
MLVFSVPPGIGDISWCYSKVADIAKRRPVGFRICDNMPQRASDYVDLLPNITNLGYTAGTFPELTVPRMTRLADLSKLEDGEYGLFLNKYLEEGHKLADIHPEQATDYHYEMNIPERCKSKAKEFLDAMKGGPRIGFYASSHQHRAEFEFWSAQEWAIFMGIIAGLFPGCSLIALGADYDDRTKDAYAALKNNGFNVTSAVGQAEIGTSIEIIRGLDFLFAFPSGLGILADVVDTPCQMWYWFKEEQKRFPNTYADPKNIESGRHMNLYYASVPDSVTFFVNNGFKWVKEK